MVETERATAWLASYGGNANRCVEFLLNEIDALRQVIRESSENRLDANAAFAAVINENGERRDLIPAIRDLQRALWVALGNSEVVVRNDTPRAVEWRNTDDGGRLVRRAPVQGER